MDIRLEFGKRVRELRARSGISQELLADRAGLDRTYISGIERGERNISLVNIEKIAAALNVSIEYLFSSERFSTNLAYLKKDFEVPFLERFKFHIDNSKKILAFQVYGLLTGENVDYMSKTLLRIASNFSEGELSIFVDHREMKASDGEPVVYSPEVAERAVLFQQKVISYGKQAVVLCNSEFMVHQMNYVTTISGIRDKATHLYGKDKDMIGKAYEMLDINGNDLIKPLR
ncbi:helix-turn-helix domain-containing protein [Paenibacillus sp. B01]|uniref:helix-turn-helix domain-containing protein n=1 Tax=Paenibacillus sp. B01 TaxID=2660554 RepID=UPI00129A603A|nr:helix-turn-helix transcriptional regulator [Paenibacillus sp. B01]QGG57887.1 helix-turn-helix domain-containing protein [Paenibacillus sp. B01]